MRKIFPKIFMGAFMGISMLGANAGWGQEIARAPTLREQVPESITGKDNGQGTRRDVDDVITLVIENDMFASNHDRNYTSGVRLGYLDLNAKMPEFARQVGDNFPLFSINETTRFFYSLGHNIYTPKAVGDAFQDPLDRPWAAILYGSLGMMTIDDNHLDEIELTLGVVGPAALGEGLQKFVHRHITDSTMPKGWRNQLKNEPALILGWQRHFPRYIYGRLGTARWSVTPHIGATLGNVYTYANTGISARLGPGSEDWQDAPLRVRPAMPGTGFFEIPNAHKSGLGWSWYLFGGVDARLVARNIFLDGNSFRSSHSVSKYPLVMDANAGIAFTYGRARISYTAVYRSREFKHGSHDVFGAISLGYRF